MFVFVNFYLDYLPEEWCISNAVYLLNQENSWKLNRSMNKLKKKFHQQI